MKFEANKERLQRLKEIKLTEYDLKELIKDIE